MLNSIKKWFLETFCKCKVLYVDMSNEDYKEWILRCSKCQKPY